jgi:GNAT superfamily N-acetyltransferase
VPEFRFATEADVPLVLHFIRELAEYERLLHEATATEEQIRASLFGERKYAEVIIASVDGEDVGFALFFHNFSTFLGKPGIYLEDLFVTPSARGKGVGKGLMVELARVAVERGCGRLEWAVLDWNEPSIEFYRSLGAVALSDWTVNRVSGPVLAALAQRTE